MAPTALRNGFSVIPVQNDELRLLMEIMNLPASPDGPRSVLISRGHCDFPEFLASLKNAGILVSVIAVDEPMPAGFESLVENWINVPSAGSETEKPEESAEVTLMETPEEVESAVLSDHHEAEEVQEIEETAEAEETPEVEENNVPETEEEEEKPEELPSSEEVVSLLNIGGSSSSSNVIPKGNQKVRLHVTSAQKYDDFVQEKANRIVQKLDVAIEECVLQKMHLEDQESGESPVKFTTISAQTELHTLELMAEIFGQLKIAYDWFGRVLSENPIDPKMEKPIVHCGNCALRLLGMYYSLVGHETDQIYNTCFQFINDEVKTNYNQNRLDFASRRKKPRPLSELGLIEKNLCNLKKLYADLVSERQVTGRLEANVKSLKSNPENRSEIFSCIMDDIHQLFTYFSYKPESDFIFKLFSQYMKYFPEESEYSDEFYKIRSEIEYRKAEEEMANCSPAEMENKYRFNVDVQTVRKRFEGKTLVVIGGIPKPTQKGNFEKAFGCKVKWRETSHCESLDFYVPYLSNPDVCAFMVLTPFASHKHSEELGALASNACKPFFRVTKINPIPAAKQIVEQYLEG
ncbi:MAG: hypothetical protein IJK97_09540 [Thermoguttaceae bacterium]|nr:hypothetical protein [Thermoguttaceae bacterium]